MATYFAYGSNMNHEQLRARCPSARFLCPGQLGGHRLAFTRYSSKRASVIADILPTLREAVWGGLFELSPEDLLALDRSEGTHLDPPAYRRVAIEVTPQSQPHDVVTAFTYEVVVKSLFKPTPAHLGLIIEGAKHCSLPADYIQNLRTIEVA